MERLLEDERQEEARRMEVTKALQLKQGEVLQKRKDAQRRKVLEEEQAHNLKLAQDAKRVANQKNEEEQRKALEEEQAHNLKLAQDAKQRQYAESALAPLQKSWHPPGPVEVPHARSLALFASIGMTNPMLLRYSAAALHSSGT